MRLFPKSRNIHEFKELPAARISQL
jgi:hypothetical protein